MKTLTTILLSLSIYFTFAQTGPGGVGDVNTASNLVLWLNPDKGANTNTAFIDQSNYGYDFSNGNGAILNSNSINGHNSYSYNGATNYFEHPNETNLNPDNFSVFAVNKVLSSDKYKTIFSSRNSSANAMILYSKPNTNEWTFWTADNGWQTLDTGATTTDNWAIHLCQYEPGTNGKKVFINNNLIIQATHNYAKTTTYPFRIGAGFNEGSPDYFFNGEMGEIIMFKISTSDVENTIINNYLSAKYNLALDNNDIYTQDDPANGDFDFNVAGIGQATDGSNHTDSQGTGVIRINTPSALANDDYLFWGENVKDASYEFATTSEYTERLNTTWRVSKQNDIGTVTLSVKDTDIDLAGKTSCASLELILSGNADFSNKTRYNMILSNGIYTATDVDFSDGDYFTFEYFDKIVVDGTKFYNGSGANNVPNTSDGCYKLLVKNTENGEFPLTESCVVSEVEVENGGVLVVNDAIDFEVTNGILLDGEIRMIGDAQLNQTHTGTSLVTGIGKLYIDQTSNLSNVYQSGYWSSPVVTSGNTYTIAGAMKDGTTPTSKDSNPLDINFITGYDGDDTTTPISISNYWLAKLTNASDWDRHRSENTAYNPTEGYNMKSSGANQQNYTFVGKPNDGDYSSDITNENSSLLGNPYPSAMDADKFLTTNSTLFNTLYFWDGSNDNSNTHVRSAYEGGYATYVTDVGTAFNNGVEPNGIIAVGQGFFVDATATGTIVFNNNHRIYDTTGHLYARPVVLPILRLGLDFEVSETETYHRQLAIAFRGDNRELDNHDAPMYDFRPTDFSVIVENQTSDYVITGEPNFNDDLEIPLHVKLDQQRELSFKIDALENFTPNNVYLKDNNTGMYYDLANPISITVEAGDYHDRFSITFTNSVALINDITKDNNVTIIDNVDYLALNSNLSIKQISVYNTLGQELVNKSGNSSQINLPVKLAKNSVVFVVVKLENGQVITKKMVKK